MERHILQPEARVALWDIWKRLRYVINNKAPYTFRDAEHGDALRDTAQCLRYMLDIAAKYDDQQSELVRIRSYEDVYQEDQKRLKEDKQYKSPRCLVLDDKAFAYLQDLKKRFYSEKKIELAEAELMAAHLYAVIEDHDVYFNETEAIYIHYDTFHFHQQEAELQERDLSKPIIYRYDDVTWKPFLAAIARGEKVEVDEASYHYWMETLPPKLWHQFVEMIDGTKRRVDFGEAEGSGVPITGYWEENGRYFAQLTKLRTKG